MAGDLIGRPGELRAVSQFLNSVEGGPAALLLEGEAGIGKTTLWLAGVEQARERGLRVLVARPAASEARLSFVCLADLLHGVDAVVRALPDPQRRAVDVVLMRGETGLTAADPRATGAAFLAILEQLAEEGPVLVAIDDAQWVDQSSASAIDFAVRRMRSRVGLLAVRRLDGNHSSAGLAPPRVADPDATVRLRVGPLSLGALHSVLRARTGTSFARPTMVRIREASGGNPFYAIELARSHPVFDLTDPGLPDTLASLVAARIASVPIAVRRLLLAIAALAEPTVELAMLAVRADPAEADRLMGVAERAGIIRLEGHYVRFTHPLLAAGVHAETAPSDRRAMHRRLADLVAEPEERARHLALGATRGDPHTISALDEAAASARARGAPAAAAELLDMAIRLGAHTPERRICAAQCHFTAGDTGRARRLIEEVLATVDAGPARGEALLVMATVRLHDDDFLEAAGCLEQAMDEADQDLALRVRVAVELLFVLVNLGRIPDALKRAPATVSDAELLAEPDLLAKAVAAATMIGFLSGQGLDEAAIQRALALEDPNLPTPVMLRPSLISALLLAWTGRLDEARDRLFALRQRCLERGEESDLMFTSFHTVIVECWRGDLISARLLAEDTMERALQLGTDIPLAIALSTRANVAAYTGDAEQTRQAATRALEVFQRGSCLAVTVWPTVTLGFLELSQGDHEAAAETLTPLAQAAVAMGYGEPMAAPFAPDTIEALIGVGRLAEAAALLDQLESNGQRLDRAWALALSARCRALLLAAQGNPQAAQAAAERALAEHEWLPMPFERARTLLVLGQLYRRRRQKRAARVTLQHALNVFDEIGTPLWAARARAELDRVVATSGTDRELTATERRVAELAATGMTNRAVAAALFISPKTIEASLSRVYQKLGIRSRAELGRRMAELSR